MKMKLFTLVLIAFSFLSQVKAENSVSIKSTTPSITMDLSLHLVTNVRRSPTPYLPAYNTNVRLLTYSDWFPATPRGGDTQIPYFAYNPWAMLDGKVAKIVGYWTDYDTSPYKHYAYVSIVVSGTTYYLYWPAYFDASSGGVANFINYMQAA